MEGGSVGIAILPSEWDKVQVLNLFHDYETIIYFGDKYLENGNDYKLLNHKNVIGYAVDSPKDTLACLRSIILY